MLVSPLQMSMLSSCGQRPVEICPFNFPAMIPLWVRTRRFTLEPRIPDVPTVYHYGALHQMLRFEFELRRNVESLVCDTISAKLMPNNTSWDPKPLI